VQWQKGHRYLTLVYQIDGHSRRLLHIAPERTVRSLLSFFRMLGKTRSAALKFVCSDMWQPYLKVIAKKAAQAVHVLDRFHVMVKMNKALDEVRAAETKREALPWPHRAFKRELRQTIAHANAACPSIPNT
jgi:transposase